MKTRPHNHLDNYPALWYEVCECGATRRRPQINAPAYSVWHTCAMCVQPVEPQKGE